MHSTADATPPAVKKIDAATLRERVRALTCDVRNGRHTLSGEDLELELLGKKATKAGAGESPTGEPRRSR